MTRPLGKNMLRALEFARRYPQCWHTYNKDRATRHAIARLVRRGLVIVNSYGQYMSVP